MNIENNMELKNTNLNQYACKDDCATRLKEEKEDFRTPYFHDIDKIIYTLAFLRYKDKTQVFTFKGHDHLSKRMMHVIYVSKIARTIGRALGLNEDLIEAAALGHDLGHTPFGHVGEAILNEISLKNNEGYFNHNIQSVRLLMDIENYGKGSNITLQVLDAIMCHNGEFILGEYYPSIKTKENFLEQYNLSYKNESIIKKLKPMTLEGCVVRISDMIAYLGRDIEDGKRVGLITEDEIPEEITQVLGKTNREIVNTIILDIIENSIGKNYIKLSDKIYLAMKNLKNFNKEKIYSKAYTDEENTKIKEILNSLFQKYMNDLESHNTESNIIKSYLNNMSNSYKSNTKERIVIDYIAGMTDEYCIKEYNKICENSYNKKEVDDEI